ncbi:MAG: hypothetical protein KatS3mg108_0371 [Isosphaeraceae bacterium]|jgi:hypothetical protein|nr:MAG: hypothetical protein KatS3mg108_0371 [Isosphaeraceae bacterium]
MSKSWFTTGGLTLALGLAVGLTGPSAQAQTPQPLLPDDQQRSGLVTRHLAIIPSLPHDPDRDDWYVFRRGDRPADPTHPNWMLNSGLYGLPLKCDCTYSFRPYFQGSEGGNYGPQCRKVHWRPLGNLLHPWRPVYSYYSGGSYSPVYDLDPIAPGPGPYPFPLLYKRQHPGG